MAIRTSAITYRRGIPNNYYNFYYISQYNYNIINNMSSYLKGYNFYNRNTMSSSNYRWPWRP